MTTQYTTIQKISLAGMVIGSLMCVVGAFAPYWIVSDPKGFSGLADLVGKVVKGNMGLFIYCIRVNVLGLAKSGCKVLPMETDSGWFHSARVSACGCVLLGGLCGLISLCLACCNCCKRFIVLGILSFLAAAAGAFCAIVFCQNMDAFTSMVLGFKLTSYGWAFYIFCTGTGILGVVSFTACFAAPENPIHGMVLSAPGNQLQVVNSTVTNHPYMHLQEQGGPMGHPPPVDPGVTVVTANGY